MKAVDEMDMGMTAESGMEEKVIQMEQPGKKDGGATESDSGDDVDDDADDEVDMYVKFQKPYVFEDDTYEGIDMSGIENLTADDLTEIEKKFYKQSIPSFNPENTATYAKLAAWKATGLPIEFFNQLPAKDMMKIKSRVVNFFYN